MPVGTSLSKIVSMDLIERTTFVELPRDFQGRLCQTFQAEAGEWYLTWLPIGELDAHRSGAA